VTKTPEQPAVDTIDLKDPALAAFLAWLIPGLGHWYQGRRAKAVLYFVCIMGVFVYGLYLGSSNETCLDGKGTIGCGRAVYFSWRDSDRRLPYLCQVFVGLPALPALIQADRMSSHRKVWWNGFMAPPRLPFVGDDSQNPNLDQPTPNDLHRRLHRYFELATFFTMVGGLLNVLAIYDAVAGPVASLPDAKKKEEEAEEDEKKKEEAKQ
jgi:hypothetical protein